MKSKESVILEALGKCSMEYFKIVLELLWNTPQKEINYVSMTNPRYNIGELVHWKCKQFGTVRAIEKKELSCGMTWYLYLVNMKWDGEMMGTTCRECDLKRATPMCKAIYATTGVWRLR